MARLILCSLIFRRFIILTLVPITIYYYSTHEKI